MSCRVCISVRRRLIYCLLAATLLAFSPTTRGDEPEIADDARTQHVSIRLSSDQSRIEVVGVPAPAIGTLREAKLNARTWSEVLRVTVLSDRGEGATETPSMMGRFDIDDDVITFTPRFPFRPGLSYRVAFDMKSLADGVSAAPPVEAKLAVPNRVATPPTEVEAVYPSGAELPANLLKFYIHFSAPMSRGDAYRRVRVVDAKGRTVPDAFLELPEELWEASGQRLTILFDPGRIKRGLKPNEDVGAPLILGRGYALVVSPGWRDASGKPLSTEFRKEFFVVGADDKQPEPAAWHVSSPQADSQDPLTVVVNEPLDRALLERSLEVVDSEGRGVDGVVAIDDEETRWQFRPATNWRIGNYRIVIDPTLEDRAGNSIGRAFETHDPNAPIGNAVDEPAIIPFVVAP